MNNLTTDGGFVILLWTFGAVAIVLTSGRLYIRLRQLKSLKWDDVLNVLALGSLIACFAAQQLSQYSSDIFLVLRMALAADILLWTTLYLVKAAFLALMIKIFGVSANFRKAWWAVTIYTFITFWPIVISELWQCGPPSDYDNPASCTSPPDYLQRLSLAFASFKAAFHISSDVLLCILPIAQLRNMNMSRVKKISVAAVFALVIIDIIGGVLKNAAIICALQQATPWGAAYLYDSCIDIIGIWSICEPGIAVIVCTLPVYRTVLPSSQDRRRKDAERQRNAILRVNRQLRNVRPMVNDLQYITEGTEFGEEWVGNEMKRLNKAIGQSMNLAQ